MSSLKTLHLRYGVCASCLPVCLNAAGVVGVLLNFASLWCVGATSATTYAVVGSVNVVRQSLLDIATFFL